MRVILCYLGLLFAAPAFANSMEDGLCPKASSFAEMEMSERLCRSFILALQKLPAETTKEVQAMLSPESLAVMGGVTATWLGTQGIPVVGQAVDAAFLSLGVIALASQTTVVTDAVWKYVKYASEARDDSELELAATHLARAMATVGVNVVTFILTKKVAGKIETRPGLSGPLPELLPGPVPVAMGGHASSAAGTTVGVVPGTSVAPALAITGGRSGGGRVPPVNAKPKKVNLKDFKGWLEKAKRRPVPERSEAYQYQRKHAGSEEILASGGGKQVWADGARMDSARLVEVKHIGAADNSPFVPGSKCDDYVRSMIQDEVAEEFSRYAAVINDPRTPAVALEVVVNESRAAPFFETLLRRFEIPGEVLVRP
jgi:hypothetical protein